MFEVIVGVIVFVLIGIVVCFVWTLPPRETTITHPTPIPKAEEPEIVKKDDPTDSIEYFNKHKREIVKIWSVIALTGDNPRQLEDVDNPRHLLPGRYYGWAFDKEITKYYSGGVRWHPENELYTERFRGTIDSWVEDLWHETHRPGSTYHFDLSEEEIKEVRQRVLFHFLIESGKENISNFIHESLRSNLGTPGPGHLVMVDAIEEVVYNKTLERLVAYTTFLPKPHFFQLAQTNYPELIMELIQEFKENRQ